MKKQVVIIFYLLFSVMCLAQHNINPNLFGFRMSTSFIFFDVEDSVFTKRVVDLNPQLLSFPGGFGNFYHLKGAGYGVDLNEVSSYNKGGKTEVGKSLNWISKKKGHTKNYIYDFISLAKRMQSKVIFNINILNEPIEDYLRVLEIFEENDIEVIAVELGGELYTREYKDVIDGELYINLAKRCANNVREYYPDVLIGVVAAPVNTLRRHNFWNKKLALEEFYDAIIVHSYAKVTKGIAVDGKMVSEKQESIYENVSFSLYKERAIKYLNSDYPDEILEYNVAFDDKPIWITEWNLQMSKITANTMLQALFTASYLLEASTNPKLKSIELTTFHNMAGRTLSASMLLKKKNKMHVLVTYKPMKMLSEIFQNKDYKATKEDIGGECFKYIFTKEDRQIICWVNWSEKELSAQIPAGSWIQKDLSGENLYSTTFDQDEIRYNEKEVTNKIMLKPYSFTMLIQNE